MSVSPARPWIIMALIFVLGAITGSLLTIGLGPRFAPAPPGPQEMGNHWMMHLAHRLNLTDDQQGKIRPIVMDAESQIVSTHRQDVDAISKIMADANSKISQVLNPDQQAQLKQMESERERMFHHHGHGGPDGDFHHSGPDHPPGPPPDQAPASDSSGHSS